jgi:hypothetical protein
MHRTIPNLLFAGSILALSLVGVNLLAGDNTSKAEHIHIVADGISRAELEFDGGRIFLNVHLLRPLTCREVINQLGVSPMWIKNKTYSPSCSTMSDRLIRISYTETIAA